MATLDLAPDLRAALGELLARLPAFFAAATDDGDARSAIDQLSNADREPLTVLLRACHGLIAENGWVHLKGLPFLADARALHTLGHGLGALFRDLTQQASIIVEARPGIGQPLQGCHTRALPLHTDFAMLEKPPALTLLHCREPDPVGITFVRNGISDVRDLLSRHFGDPVLEALKTQLLPFAGRRPNGEDVLIERPLIQETSSRGGLLLRFHPSRIHHGFRVRGRPATAEEAAVLRSFSVLATAVRTEVCLEPGDVLVIDNHRVLHDRSPCTLRLGLTGHIARIAYVLFVQELWPT